MKEKLIATKAEIESLYQIMHPRGPAFDAISILCRAIITIIEYLLEKES